MQTLKIFRIGRHVIDDPKSLEQFITAVSRIEGPKMIVHGGGKAMEDLTSSGPEQLFSNGKKITGGSQMVMTMVYAGLINKTLVGLLNVKGARAVGICGTDQKSLPGVKKNAGKVDFGFVAEIDARTVNVVFLSELIDTAVPVISPVSQDFQGISLSEHADSVATTIAIAMKKNFNTELYMCFEKAGILRNGEDESSLIQDLSSLEIEVLKKENVISGRLIPKIDNAIRAIENGVSKVVICKYENILKAVNGEKNSATYFTASPRTAGK